MIFSDKKEAYIIYSATWIEFEFIFEILKFSMKSLLEAQYMPWCQTCRPHFGQNL